MIPGSGNGQVWIAKEIKKVDPVARTTVAYPTELDENLSVSSALLSVKVKPVLNAIFPNQQGPNNYGTVDAEIVAVATYGTDYILVNEFAGVTATMMSITSSGQKDCNIRDYATVSAELTDVTTAGSRYPMVIDFGTVSAGIVDIFTTTA